MGDLLSKAIVVQLNANLLQAKKSQITIPTFAFSPLSSRTKQKKDSNVEIPKIQNTMRQTLAQIFHKRKRKNKNKKQKQKLSRGKENDENRKKGQ